MPRGPEKDDKGQSSGSAPIDNSPVVGGDPAQFAGMTPAYNLTTPVLRAMNPLQKIGGMLRSAFGANAQPNTLQNDPRRGRGYYQVRRGDTFAGIAKGIGISPNVLSALNQGAASLPPVGSYIATRDEISLAADPRNDPRRGRGYQEYVRRNYEPAGLNRAHGQSLRGQSADQLRFEAYGLQQAFALGQPISRISSQAAGVLGWDYKFLTGLGFDFDINQGAYVAPTGSSGGGGGGASNRDRRGNLIRNPSQYGNREQRQSDRGGGIPDNAGDTPTTVLNLRLGSG